MYDQLIERINRGFRQQITAFFLLWFAVYGTAWTIIEPLGFTFDKDTLPRWRIIFIVSTFILCCVIFFFVFFKRKLERFGTDQGDTDLKSTANLKGFAEISIADVGSHGQVFKITTQSDADYIDWNIKASAHKAKLITFTYKPIPDLYFYVRVRVRSKKNKQSSTPKWLRLETSYSTYQSNRDDEEMGVPVTASDDDGFLRVIVNIDKIIATAFGNHGWRFDKVIGLRSRRSGLIKSIELK